MKKVDQRCWAATRSLREVAELTALWLEGKLASQPGYLPDCGPDAETADLVPTLVALNRAGWLTDVSQPGWGPGPGYDGATWAQRAGVGGFTDPRLADRIEAAACAAGLIVVRHDGASRWAGRNSVTVTTRSACPHTGFGARWSRRELSSQYLECGNRAVAEIKKATQLTVVDPEWGRDDLLWPVLRRQAQAAGAVADR
jgi:hypothetical protein